MVRKERGTRIMIEVEDSKLLVRLDELDEQISYAKMVMEEYEELKKNLKKVMSNACEQVNADQLKWETPNGTKITFSKGHIAEIEKEKTQKFNVEKLQQEYPDVYEKCLEEVEISVIKKNATSDTIRITQRK